VDLGTPLPIAYGEAVLATIKEVIAGSPASNSSFIVMQTDMGDGFWVDLAWLLDTTTSNATLNYLLSAGVAGANAVKQTRAAAAAPGSTGSNQVALGSRIRFVGNSTLSGGSSPSVTVSINVKILGLR
jgi:hypothetical protein